MPLPRAARACTSSSLRTPTAPLTKAVAAWAGVVVNSGDSSEVLVVEVARSFRCLLAGTPAVLPLPLRKVVVVSAGDNVAARRGGCFFRLVLVSAAVSGQNARAFPPTASGAAGSGARDMLSQQCPGGVRGDVSVCFTQTKPLSATTFASEVVISRRSPPTSPA